MVKPTTQKSLKYGQKTEIAMNSNTSKCALFLSPKHHNYTISNSAKFITQLTTIGLISKPTNLNENSFYTGERFLDYVAYLGCSPNIQFEASNKDENFCQIKIHQYASEKLFVSRIQSRAPHCPNCNKPVENWLENKTDTDIHCILCNTTSKISEFNWRRMAGYARVFIENH